MNPHALILKLMQTDGIGARTILRILRAADDTQCEPEALLNSEGSDLFQRFRIPGDLIERLGTDSAEAENLLEELREHNIRMVVYASDDYPTRLAQTLGDTAPPALFIHGNIDLLKQPTVAVCGSRNVSTEGSEATSELVGQLAGWGVNVISGAAAGVDQAAHSAAVTAGGVTTVVLPTGILSFNMTDLLDDATGRDKLLVISEFYPRAKWTTWGAMQRNNTIVALSQAVVAVEPGMSGGTFEAARAALKLGRPLYLPASDEGGQMTEEYRYFLKRGAIEIRKTDDSPIDVGPITEIIRTRHKAGD